MTLPGKFRLGPLAAPFAVALAIRWLGAWLSHGQSVVDVASFDHWATRLDEGQNPYESPVNPANYPPLWLYICWMCLTVSRWTGLTFDLVMKLTVSAADAATVIPVGLLARMRANSDSAGTIAAVGYALNPVSILIAAFHAQNDPMLIGLIVWSVWLLTAAPIKWSIELAGLAVGVSVCIKPVGVLILPLMAVFIQSWVRRASWVLLVSAPMLVTALPFLLDSPVALLGAVATYRGPPDFGYVGIYNAWMNLGHGSSGEPIVKSLPVSMRFAYLLVFLVIWWKFRRASLVEQSCAVLLSLYLFYGALGAQYLVWLIPFGAVLNDRYHVRASVAASIALVAFYQLNHPAILTGTIGVQLKTGIAIPQWTGILLIAQAWLYVIWFRWLRELTSRADQLDRLDRSA
jgi:hypothetical protein